MNELTAEAIKLMKACRAMVLLIVKVLQQEIEK